MSRHRSGDVPDDRMQNPIDKTILIVEDEAIIALDTAANLRKEGYSVLVASTGEGAIEIVAGNPGINLILMDINLGHGIDGTDAAVEILKLRDIPIVFLSSHTQKEMVERTENITSYGFVFKHSGTAILIASLKMAFRLHEARRQLQISEERYHSFVRQSNEGIYCLELEKPVDVRLPVETQIDLILEHMRIAECNDAFMAIYEASSPSQIIGRRFSENPYIKNSETSRNDFRSFINAGYRLSDLQTSETRPEGTTLYFNDNAIGFIENGFLKRIWGTRTDISDRKRLEDLLR